MSKYIKGKQEVRAIRNTKRGSSDNEIPKGTIGYIMGSRPGMHLVYWPKAKKQYAGDTRVSIHMVDDLEKTGMTG